MTTAIIQHPNSSFTFQMVKNVEPVVVCPECPPVVVCPECPPTTPGIITLKNRLQEGLWTIVDNGVPGANAAPVWVNGVLRASSEITLIPTFYFSKTFGIALYMVAASLTQATIMFNSMNNYDDGSVYSTSQTLTQYDTGADIFRFRLCGDFAQSMNIGISNFMMDANYYEILSLYTYESDNIIYGGVNNLI